MQYKRHPSSVCVYVKVIGSNLTLPFLIYWLIRADRFTFKLKEQTWDLLESPCSFTPFSQTKYHCGNSKLILMSILKKVCIHHYIKHTVIVVARGIWLTPYPISVFNANFRTPSEIPLEYSTALSTQLVLVLNLNQGILRFNTSQLWKNWFIWWVISEMLPKETY